MNQQTTAGFRDVCAEHAAGVCIVIWRSESGVQGVTMSSVNSVSADPPVLAFSLNAASGRYASLLRAENVSVSMLGADQADLAAEFAVRGVDPIPGLGWRFPDTTEPPVVPGCRAWLRGRVDTVASVGSSTVFIFGARNWGVERLCPPLIWFRRQYATTVPSTAGASTVVP